MSPEKQVSRGAVEIYKDYTGRGPEKATTKIFDDQVSTICRGVMTKAEKRLVERGEGDVVRSVRRKFQDVMRDDYMSMVETVVDRKAESFFSDHDSAIDVAVEIVILAE